MPGSIQVSVLDLKELPSSSNSHSPLMNLRDDLIITVVDSEGNQVSHSGVRTMSILEKGAWDDVFSIEGGGLIHMKLEFILSDEERNRIRSMRESAMKKKQAEILGSRLRNAESAKFLALSSHRHEVSDVLRATSSQDFQRGSFNDDIVLKASESFDGIKEESIQRQSFTVKDYNIILCCFITLLVHQLFLLQNATDNREETSFSHMTEEIEQNPNRSGNLVEKSYMQKFEDEILSDVKKTNEESTSNKSNEFLLQQDEVPKKLLEDTKTCNIQKNNNAVKTIPLDNLVEKLDQQNLEDRNLSFLKKMSKERKFPPFSQETEVKTNEIQLQETDLPKRLKDSSSSDVGSSRLTVAEKIKSFSPKLAAGEMDKQASLEKTPQNIKKMISVFESSLSKDRVPLKSVSTKSNRFGTSRLLKDSESNLKNSETSSSRRLRNSFSTGDLRKNLSSIITKEDQVESDDDFVESAEINMQSKGNDSNGTRKMPKEAQGDETMRLLSNPKIEEKCHQEKIVDSLREIVVKVSDFISVDKMGGSGWGEETERSESADIDASNGSFGQVMKIALVIGFGVVVLLFRQRETRKGKQENTRAPTNIVLMNKRGSIEEQRRRIGVSWSS
ncbi:hypothetical protein L1987_50159 [Smallanthus sonchifolius]|uniref:Uncharacterized protein n=1 Tax=Smallanthus sonchifolius TaxID=185202 RepID=A0ACB9FXQ0_9ASTR|nr:hypothetical protein L1987_50159 [Smallanthus sonchifolius]